jgi:hypothetical protein
MANEANKAAGITGGGPTLREWITTHLGLYLPGSVGPSAWDMTLTACAGLVTVKIELGELEAAGLVAHSFPGIGPEETPLEGQEPRWTLTESGWAAVHETLAKLRKAAPEEI